jgi:hypothetical protein
VGWVFSCKRNKYLILPSSLLDKALNERNSIAPSTFNRLVGTLPRSHIL